MLIIPALDLRAGALARRPDTDPLTLLARWHDATWLHVADLDRAFGTGQNDALVELVLRSARRPIQLGGAMSNWEDVGRWLDAGAGRVIVGAHAETRREAEPQRLGIAIDVVGGKVVPPGRDALEETPAEVAARAVDAGIRTIVWRDRDRDGMLTGADLTGARRIMEVGADVQYAGGVADLADLRRARDAGFHAVIVGRALLEGVFTLEEAVACLA